MLSESCDQSMSSCQFLIRPNQSLTRRGFLWIASAVFVLSMSIAIRYYFLGAWLVLPFTILEMLFLATISMLVWRHNRCFERITVDEHEISIIRQNNRDRQQWKFQSYWVQVILQIDSSSWYPSRLLIRSHGRSIEVGKDLTDSERKELADRIKQVLDRVRQLSTDNRTQ